MEESVDENIDSDTEALALEKLRLLWTKKNKYKITDYLNYLVGYQGKFWLMIFKSIN